MDMEHIDRTSAFLGKTSLTSGSGTLILGSLSISEVAAIVGAVTTTITCIAYVYFKVKHYQLDRELKQHQIEQLKRDTASRAI